MGSANGGGVAPLEKAATLVLLRDAPGGFEVLLLKRHEKSGVAPGALVFPGGRVDLMDDEPELAPQLVRALASGGPATLQVTAIRETFEECAILLAREVDQTEMVSATRAEELEHYRGLLQGGDISLAQFLSRENLLLACDKLIHYANWVTPDFMPRRFDTHFFLAVAPPEQLAIEDGHESISVNWLRPAKALELIDSGHFTALLPTICNLHRMSLCKNVAQVISDALDRSVIPVTPRLDKETSGLFLRIPTNVGYTLCEQKIEKSPV